MYRVGVTAMPDRSSEAVAGVDIGGTKIDVAVASLDGNVLGRRRIETRAAAGPTQAFQRIAEALRDIRDREARNRSVTTVGGVSPGIVRSNQILLSPNLPGWERVGLASSLAEATGIDEVAVTNDVRAGALAEARFGALKDCRCGMYVSLGTGIAAALVIAGQVIDGAHQAAGEIAYSRPVGTLGAARDGGVTGHAQLEEVISGRALADRAEVVLGERVDAAALFGRSDPVAAHLVHQGLAALGTALANLAVFIDPEIVVIGGGMSASADVLVPILAAYLRDFAPFAPDVVVGRYDDNASLHGAIALAVDAADTVVRGERV